MRTNRLKMRRFYISLWALPGRAASVCEPGPKHPFGRKTLDLLWSRGSRQIILHKLQRGAATSSDP